ncbi:hypothetical protein BTZ20_3589 [Rhodococcus sp. MTM3W5.2]|uniref:hypothetical protein n=1 Tax=Rhodococcus sp. MTM3W5.2 TaxID=1805827 RepID=UPI0009793C36|nr:hypothetical protein [Rhodococcus sp. MTM3W5.2]AQA26154.1 hypothetical protein BTZ20_3589 [Rhodococcus sp. MTM3W5.2]
MVEIVAAATAPWLRSHQIQEIKFKEKTMATFLTVLTALGNAAAVGNLLNNFS